jgi:hypothetical protein
MVFFWIIIPRVTIYFRVTVCMVFGNFFHIFLILGRKKTTFATSAVRQLDRCMDNN